MIQSAKKEVFGHFMQFGLSDRLDIAYCDSTTCFPTIGNVLVCEIDPHLLTAVASCNEAEILAEQAAVPQLQLRPTAEIVSPSVRPSVR